MNRAFVFPIFPNKDQAILINKTFSDVRFTHNLMLSEILDYYDDTGKTKRITPAEYKKDFTFLKMIDSLALANEQLSIERSFRRYKSGKSGRPRFMSRKNERKSYTTNLVNNNIRIEGKHIILPKLGKVHIFQYREIPENYRLKSVTVSKSASGKYYVSILFEFEALTVMPKPIDPEKVLGVDFSMPDLYVTSEGERGKNPRYYRRREKKIARMKRALSRMVPGSNNYLKMKQRIASEYEHIAWQRKDFLHKLSRQLADTYDSVAIETINMHALAQALNFGKSVGDNGWGMLVRFLEYKLEEQGKRLIKVSRTYPSSKTCCECGAIKHDLKLSDRIFVCPFCGNTMDRDINAAINIKNEALRMLGLAK